MHIGLNLIFLVPGETGGMEVAARELILSTADLDDALNFRGVPSFGADALHGKGVFETLKGISELVLKKLAAGTAA